MGESGGDDYSVEVVDSSTCTLGSADGSSSFLALRRPGFDPQSGHSFLFLHIDMSCCRLSFVPILKIMDGNLRMTERCSAISKMLGRYV